MNREVGAETIWVGGWLYMWDYLLPKWLKCAPPDVVDVALSAQPDVDAFFNSNNISEYASVQQIHVAKITNTRSKVLLLYKSLVFSCNTCIELLFCSRLPI